MLFKHILSGKFLSIDPDTKKLILSNDFEHHFEDIKKNKIRIQREYYERYHSYTKLKETKKFEDINKKDNPLLTQADIDFYAGHGSELFNQDSDYLYAYLQRHTFVLEKVSSDESLNLNNSTFLKIRSPNNKYISV